MCYSQAEELRKEVRELQMSLKEEVRKSEAVSGALHEESRKLRMKELESDELRDKYASASDTQATF